MRTSKIGVSLLAAVIFTSTLSGCATKKETGTIIGATAGGVIGHVAGGPNHVAGAVIGLVLGGIVGNKLGEHLDDSDRERIAVILNSNSTKSQTWTNPMQETQVTVVPGPISKYRQEDCRTWATKLTKKDKKSGKPVTTTTETTSCNRDGKWVEMVSKK